MIVALAVVGCGGDAGSTPTPAASSLSTSLSTPIVPALPEIVVPGNGQRVAIQGTVLFGVESPYEQGPRNEPWKPRTTSSCCR